jgi:hypothetical protein
MFFSSLWTAFEGLILTCRQLADGLVLAGGLLLLAEF